MPKQGCHNDNPVFYPYKTKNGFEQLLNIFFLYCGGKDKKDDSKISLTTAIASLPYRVRPIIILT